MVFYIQVTSGLVVERLSVVARRIDVTVTLIRVSHAELKYACEKNLQSTKGEDTHQRSLLVDRQLASPNRLHGEAEDKDICGNGEAGICVPVLRQADTSRMY